MENTHPVIQHLLARTNKKVPIEDNRKIALILFGGAIAGVRGAAAELVLNDIGLSNAFDEIYSASAGFCNASYLLSDNPKEGIAIYYEDLCGDKFINYLKPWRIADIEYVVNCVKNLKPLKVRKILESETKLFVRVKDVKEKKEVLLEAHEFPDEKYFQLMRAATAVPYLSPGAIKVGGIEYKDIITDGGWASIVGDILKSDITDLLIIYNTRRQYDLLHNKIGPLLNSDRVFEIVPEKSWKFSKLERDAKSIKNAAEQMIELTKNIFGVEKEISLN